MDRRTAIRGVLISVLLVSAGLLAALVVGSTAVTWVAFELYWSGWSLRVPDRFG